MLRSVLARLAARVGRDGDADGESGDSRFVPSVLDRSVRYAHGGGGDEAERELAAVEERARRIEEQQPEK